MTSPDEGHRLALIADLPADPFFCPFNSGHADNTPVASGIILASDPQQDGFFIGIPIRSPRLIMAEGAHRVNSCGPHGRVNARRQAHHDRKQD